ncbi:MAG: hypothetical protein D3906_04500 [Candidatus Electrothrix sp. AUS1_2]|nr:hypothetical protein [Candidatus Electrothrix sp. AUS1_2]
MSENVQIVLIAAGALVVIIALVVFILKDRLRSGNIKGNREGVQVDWETHAPIERPVTKITGAKIKGDENAVSARDGAQMEESDIEGKNRLDGTNG